MKESKMVNAAPVKSFFVQMLTRDIELKDAILDLLDNCIDGVLRTEKAKCAADRYAGHNIDIKISEEEFTIKDDCGGIPYEILVNYAFRMGRVDGTPMDNVPTVGSYGIGMKRAIFKMGERCEVRTRYDETLSKDGKVACVKICPEWIKNENEWEIPFSYVRDRSFTSFGTEIKISDLNESTRAEFKATRLFVQKLKDKIATTYGFMIEKGLNIRVNDDVVTALHVSFKFNDQFKPYVFRTRIDDVDIDVSIGIAEPQSSDDEIFDDSVLGKYASQYSGWMVLCNDRVVLSGDKTELTGWGEAGVPQYHPQYNSIRGIVSFSSNDVTKLPTTTTKRGIDGGNLVYLKVKNVMREGMKRFIAFTNAWKRQETIIRSRIMAAPSISYPDLRAVNEKSSKLKFVDYKKGIQGRSSKEVLLLPPKTRNEESSKWTKCTVRVETCKIDAVAELVRCPGGSAPRVIESAFNYAYKMSRE